MPTFCRAFFVERVFGSTLQRTLFNTRRMTHAELTLATMPVQVKRMGWRGLWMTKNIEGTVDDDIAAKLAIGEGRQVKILHIKKSGEDAFFKYITSWWGRNSRPRCQSDSCLYLCCFSLHLSGQPRARAA